MGQGKNIIIIDMANVSREEQNELEGYILNNYWKYKVKEIDFNKDIGDLK